MLISLDSPPKLAGKKRKRYIAVEEDTSVKLTGKLHHYLREMRKAAKKSRTFEVQRLVKKLKYLRKHAHASGTTVLEDLEDLEAQLTSLKKTDHERIAYLALSSKIRKDSSLGSNQLLMASLASAMSNPADGNTVARHAKVESRLLSSKILAAEAHEVVKGLRAILEARMATKYNSNIQDLDLNDEQDGMDDENEGADQRPESAMLTDEADDLVDDDGWESGSIDGIQPRNSGGGDDEETAEEEEKEEEEEEEAKVSRSSRQNSKQLKPSSGLLNPSKSAASSTFLPSLSAGYIKGDSDSDIEPSDSETAANSRKNRRGQRARQAIWEKRYGKNAKHVKKQREDAQSAATARKLGKRPDQGWQGRGPTRTSDRAVNSKRRAQTQSRGQLEGHLPSERPVHPSWEAKRKLKEKESGRILPAQGKKIVFN